MNENSFLIILMLFIYSLPSVAVWHSDVSLDYSLSLWDNFKGDCPKTRRWTESSHRLLQPNDYVTCKCSMKIVVLAFFFSRSSPGHLGTWVFSHRSTAWWQLPPRLTQISLSLQRLPTSESFRTLPCLSEHPQRTFSCSPTLDFYFSTFFYMSNVRFLI